MKAKVKRNLVVVILTILFIVPNQKGFAQLDQLDKLLQAGEEDANALLSPYLAPFMRGFGYGLANSWYNTAEVHKGFGFDLMITGTLAYVPGEDLKYNVLDLNLQEIEIVSPRDGEVPTVFGDDLITPQYQFKSTPGLTFDGPTGLNLQDEIGGKYIPTPMVQIGIGFPLGITIRGRYMPEVDAGQFKSSFWGVGIQHDIKQYLGAVDKIPFDLSVLVGYTQLNSTIGLSGAIDDGGAGDQEGVIKANAWTYQVLISKNLSIVTFYGGVGANTLRSRVQILGTYILTDPGIITLTDPINQKYKDGGVRGTLGMKLKLGPITLHGDYTFQKYNALTAGIGVSVR